MADSSSYKEVGLQLTAGNLCFKPPFLPFSPKALGPWWECCWVSPHSTPAGRCFSSRFLRPPGEGNVLHEKCERRGLQGCLLGWKSWGWGGELGFLLQVRPWVSGLQPCSCVPRLTLLGSHCGAGGGGQWLTPECFLSSGANYSRAPCPCALIDGLLLASSAFVLWPEETSQEGVSCSWRGSVGSWALVLCGDRAWSALPIQVGSRLCWACWAGRSLHPPLCFSGNVKEEVMLTVVLPLCNHNYVSLVAIS